MERGGAFVSCRRHVGAALKQQPRDIRMAISRRDVERGGAVLSLVDGESLLASVVCVLSPGGLAVWAPKEEVVGMLSLLDDGTLAPAA